MRYRIGGEKDRLILKLTGIRIGLWAWRRRRSVLPLLILWALPAPAAALEPKFGPIRYDKGQVSTTVTLADSLPDQIIKYMNKGVPIAVEYNIEIWRENPGWFDRPAAKSAVLYKVRYDSWEKRYAVAQISEGLTIEHALNREREAIDLLTSSGRQQFAVTDSSQYFYLRARLIIKTMSFSNYKEVESWLRGGISEARAPNLEETPDKVGEFIFNMALKVSGLSDLTGQVKTEPFKLGDLPIPR